MKVLVLATIVLAACVDAPAPDAGDPTTVEKLAANSLLPEQLSQAALYATTLDQANLDDMASTEDGRAVLRYLLACALAEGTWVTASYIDADGQPATIDYAGLIGLADGWTSADLTTAQQRLVSGCVLGLVNRIGGSVMVSLRGPESALSPTYTELHQFTLQEGAYFGNVFRGGEGAIACSGSGVSTLGGRDCAEPTAAGDATLCGFAYAGSCAAVCTSTNGYFVDCQKNGVTYPSPVSTYLQY